MSAATIPASSATDRRLRLADLLAAGCEAEGITAGQAARAAGCAPRYGWDALAGRAVPAEAYLALAAYLGVDPVTLEPVSDDMPPRRGPISWPFVAASIQGRILADEMTVRSVARAAGVSAATVTRASQARTVGTRCFLALAAWAGRHPHEWTIGPLHMEHPLKHAESLEQTA